MFFVLIKGFVSLICYFNHCCKYILYFIVHKVHILKKKGEFFQVYFKSRSVSKLFVFFG